MVKMGITNRKLCEDFYEQINRISKSKLDYLIIREKDLDEKKLLNLVQMVKEILKNTNIKIIINSNVDIAKKVDADGIQLSLNDFINMNSSLYKKDIINLKEKTDNFKVNGYKYKIYKLVGVSIHSYEDGIQAYELGADYVIYGHVFQTDCKKALTPRGVKEVKALSKKIDIPIIGLGGIGASNYKEVLNAGAKGIAIMSSLMINKNPKELIDSISI